MDSRDAVCRPGHYHSLSVTSQWLGADAKGNLHGLVAFCVHCSKQFECTEFRVSDRD